MFKINQLKGQVLELRGENERLRKEKTRLARELNICESHVHNLKCDIREYEGKDVHLTNHEYVRLIAHSTNDLKEMWKIKESKLEKEIKELKNENKGLKGKLEKGTTKLQMKVSLLEEDKQELLDKLNLTNNEIYNKKEEIRIINREKENLQKAFNELNAKYIHLKKVEKSIIKQYLDKKYVLLVEQNAPTPLLELITNLIEELKY